MSDSEHIPADRRARFEEVAALLRAFGESRLDPELTGFALELWRRVCRSRKLECTRGNPEIWAATVVHTIGRINFLSDRAQPVHLTLEQLCRHFGTSKTTVGSKATALERTLRLSAHAEPGLTRRTLLEQFTMVQFANGMVLPWNIAHKMGLLPPDERLEDLPDAPSLPRRE